MNKISEFQVGHSVNTTLCVVESSLKDASNGKYLSMENWVCHIDI